MLNFLKKSFVVCLDSYSTNSTTTLHEIRVRGIVNEFINDLGQMECQRATKLENGESGLRVDGWWRLSKRKRI